MSTIKKIQARASELAKTTAPIASGPMVIAPPSQAEFPNLWPEDAFAAPNISLRSALFGVSKRGRRRHVKENVAAQDGYEIAYSGETLDQADEDVWLTVLHTARRHGMGVEIHFTLNGLCATLGWPKGGRSVDRLRRVLDRLTECTVELRNGRVSFTGHLIDFMGRDEETGRLFLMLSPKMVRLFEADQYTFLEGKRRLALHTYLAKWLDGYLASHARPMPVRVETVRRLCGSSMNDLKHFRSELKSALGELQQKGAIRKWRIDHRDHMIVERANIPKTQMLHLARKELQASLRETSRPPAVATYPS